MAHQVSVPSTARGRARREEVLAAARRVFERSSYFEVRVADIAAEAGVSHGSFYTYFTSKNDVLKALVADLVDDLYSAATQRAEGQEDALTATIRAFMAAYRERADLLRVWEQAVTVDADLRASRLAIKEQFTERTQRALAAAQRRGDADPTLDSRHTAYVLGGMVEDAAYSCYVLRQGNLDEETIVRTMSRLWAKAVASGPPVGPAP